MVALRRVEIVKKTSSKQVMQHSHQDVAEVRHECMNWLIVAAALDGMRLLMRKAVMVSRIKSLQGNVVFEVGIFQITASQRTFENSK